MPKTYSIYEAKSKLSELLRLVKETGMPVIISERGKPIAQVIPYKNIIGLTERLTTLTHHGILSVSIEEKRALPKGKKKAGALKRFLGTRE